MAHVKLTIPRTGGRRASARAETLEILAAVYAQHKALGEQLARLAESVLRAKLVRRPRRSATAWLRPGARLHHSRSSGLRGEGRTGEPLRNGGSQRTGSRQAHGRQDSVNNWS